MYSHIKCLTCQNTFLKETYIYHGKQTYPCCFHHIYICKLTTSLINILTVLDLRNIMNSLTSTDRVSQTNPFILLEAEIKENPLMIYGKTYFDNFHTYHLYLIT